MWWNAEESGRRSLLFPTPSNYTWNRPAPPGLKRDTLVTTRWNPTPEQLQGLEELYRRGTRTPSAEQIQHIAARLRRFGKIEGKNVFYWFQNHKARERQKKRRQLEIHGGAAAAGLSSRRYHDNKKMATPSNYITPPQESVSMHGSVIAERRKEVWTQPNHKELQDEITSWKLDYFTPFNGFAASPPAQDDDAIKQNRTLQLFPILNNYEDDKIHDHVSGHVCLAENKSKLINEFIEFLPTKKCM